jgi:hypothetical protein
MVGDTSYDAEAAKEASTSAVGILTGGVSKESLLEAGCLVVAQVVHDLASFFQANRSQSSDAAQPQHVVRPANLGDAAPDRTGSHLGTKFQERLFFRRGVTSNDWSDFL